MAIMLTLSLIMAAVPVATVEAGPPLQWNKVSTPSMKDNVLTPGTELYDVAASQDGDTVYVTGALGELLMIHNNTY